MELSHHKFQIPWSVDISEKIEKTIAGAGIAGAAMSFIVEHTENGEADAPHAEYLKIAANQSDEKVAERSSN